MVDWSVDLTKPTHVKPITDTMKIFIEKLNNNGIQCTPSLYTDKYMYNGFVDERKFLNMSTSDTIIKCGNNIICSFYLEKDGTEMVFYNEVPSFVG